MSEEIKSPLSQPPEGAKVGLKHYLKVLGPGVIAGAADDDPAGIGTYSIAGAQLGTSLLWTAGLTWPLMAAVQMMCARIGMVTGQGLAANFKRKFPRSVLLIVCISLVFANVLNIGADLAAMADSATMMTHFNSHFFEIIFAGAILWATIYWRYNEIARVLKWFALFLFAYIIVAFYLGPDWKAVAHDAFIPSIPKDSSGWATLVAILGTTISPYLFFWQASLEVEEEKLIGRRTVAQRRGATSREIWDRKLDVTVGTFFSNIVMFFIILTTSMTLHRHGITNLETSDQVAKALEPLAGRFSSLLYTIGLLGVGFLAIPSLTGSAAYALAETFRWRQGLDETLKKAQAFYSVIIFATIVGVAIDFAHVNPVKALYWSSVVNGILAPFLLVGIYLIAADTKIMRHQASSILGKGVVIFTIALMFFAAIAMFAV